MKSLLRLVPYFYRYKSSLFWGTLFIAISNYFSVLSPQVIRHSFDLVKENIAWFYLFREFEAQQGFYKIFGAALFFFGITVLLLAVLKGVFMFFMRQTVIVMSRKIEFDMKNDMYAHYQALSLEFYKRHNTGDLMSRITEDVSRVRMFIGPAVMYGINLITLFVLVISAMIAVNPELTLYVLLPLPLLSLSIYYVNQLIHDRSRVIQEKLAGLTSQVQEVFSGIRVIKSYVQEPRMIQFFTSASRLYKLEALSLARIEAVFFPLMMLLIGLSTILTIYVGGLGVMKGSITTGNIAEFVIYVNMLTWPVTAIGWVASIIQQAAASQQRINEFMEAPIEVNETGHLKESFQGEIQFQNVSFEYPETGIQALKGVQFHIRPGQRVILTGRTGSGKTTLAELLVRMYDPTEGQILLDQRPIQDYALSGLRQQIGYVPQDAFLFSDNLANNIQFGSEPKSREQMQEAAELSGIWQDIQKIPEGLDAMIGERGVSLSGGQKQRMTIARALIKNPSIVILDDCLSAVDAETERNILNKLKIWMADKTAIIITHRLSAEWDADWILVIDEGRITEQGTHKTLIQNGGLYQELYNQQLNPEQK